MRLADLITLLQELEMTHGTGIPVYVSGRDGNPAEELYDYDISFSKERPTRPSRPARPDCIFISN